MAEADEASESFSEAERRLLADCGFAICVGSFYEDLAERLVRGALIGFERGGIGEEALEVFRVPGAFELPLAAKLCAQTGRFAGVACLGAVIRGETDHYEHVCAEAAAGIRQAGLTTGIPCAFGVLTCENMEQALARSGGDKRDQGRSAALTAMRMHLLKQELAGGA